MHNQKVIGSLNMKRTVLGLAGVMIALALAELGLRIISPTESFYYIWQPNLQHIFHPDTAVLKGLNLTSNFTINQYGLRVNKTNNRIGRNFFTDTADRSHTFICLGGSTTECLYLDDDSTWPMQLKRAGKFSFVGNAGKSGCTSLENYIQLKYFVSQCKGISEVVLMVGINDLLKALSRGELNTDTTLNTEQQNSLAQKNLLKQGRETGTNWLRRTALFYTLQRAYHKYNPTGVKWENIEDDKGEIYKTWRQHRKSAAQIIDTLPNLERPLQLFERNLNLIIDEAAKQNKALCFVGQTALWSDSLNEADLNSLWMGGVGDFQREGGHDYYSPNALKQGLNLYNEKVKEVCAKKGVKYIDLDSKIPHTSKTFYDDCHFTNYGARKVAEIIAAEIGG